MAKEVKEYYDCSKILAEGSIYNLVIGQRANGKTYGFIEEALSEYLEFGYPSVYIRRYDESITSANIFKLCSPHIDSMIIQSNGKYNNFEYKNKTFFPVRLDDKGKIEERGEPFLYCVGLGSWEHKKGQDRGFVRYIIFDEFLTRDTYLNDEYAKFMNLLSSFIRDRTGTTIIMLGNTVNKFCPYFSKFKIDMKDIKQGFIYNFRYGETTLSLEYCKPSSNTSKVNKAYFDFQEKQLDMIKNGYWEICSYPRFYSGKREDCELIGSIYIHFSSHVLRWDLLVDDDKNVISFISPSNFDKALSSGDIFMTNDSLTLLDNRMCFYEFPRNKLTQYLIETWKQNKMYFSSDDVGDIFENYMKENLTKSDFKSF